MAMLLKKFKRTKTAHWRRYCRTKIRNACNGALNLVLMLEKLLDWRFEIVTLMEMMIVPKMVPL